MFRAEQAEIVLFPSAPGDSYLITSVAEGRTSVMAEASANAWMPVHKHVVEHGTAFLLNRPTSSWRRTATSVMR